MRGDTRPPGGPGSELLPPRAWQRAVEEALHEDDRRVPEPVLTEVVLDVMLRAAAPEVRRLLPAARISGGRRRR